MTTSSASFDLTPNGWRLHWKCENTVTPGAEVAVYKTIKRIYLRGNLAGLPKAGRFCKRPHKYLQPQEK